MQPPLIQLHGQLRMMNPLLTQQQSQLGIMQSPSMRLGKLIWLRMMQWKWLILATTTAWYKVRLMQTLSYAGKLAENCFCMPSLVVKSVLILCLPCTVYCH